MDGEFSRRKPSNTALSFKGVESKTKQAFRDGTRVDMVLRKYAAMGVDANNVGLFQSNVARMEFGVADTVKDYQLQLNRVLAVQKYFASLPSKIRDRFANDPANMLDFMADPANKDECIKLGLLKAEVAPNGDTKAETKSETKGPEGAAAAPTK